MQESGQKTGFRAEVVVLVRFALRTKPFSSFLHKGTRMIQLGLEKQW